MRERLAVGVILGCLGLAAWLAVVPFSVSAEEGTYVPNPNSRTLLDRRIRTGTTTATISCGPALGAVSKPFCAPEAKTRSAIAGGLVLLGSLVWYGELRELRTKKQRPPQ